MTGASGGTIAPEAAVTIAVRFRPCRAEDLRAVEWMGLHTREREIIEGVHAAQQRDEALMLMAEAGGFPVAQAWIDFAERGSRECPHLWAVRVFPALQGAGLGRMLMAEAERLALERGARAIELGVEWDNAGARRFYRALGYVPVGAKREITHYSFEGRPSQAEFDQQILRKALAEEGRRAARSWIGL